MESLTEEEKLKRYRRRVKALQKRPQPAQRTPEWYSARNKRITASEAASCLFMSKPTCQDYVEEFTINNFKYKDTEGLNHYEKREDYIIKKCAAFYGESVFKDSIYTLWGKKYEEVANILYCQLNDTTVIEFGLVPHTRLKWLAASPDGITPDGIMLEIKCPKSRKIDETRVPIHYWVQTQIQMEVVDLDFCDFFECEIEELDSQDEFLSKEVGDKQAKGIVLEIANTGPDPKFIYPPIHVKSTEQYIQWKNQQMESRDDLIPSFYFITKYNNQRVKRSKNWFNNVKTDLKRTWDVIMNLQELEENFKKYKRSIHEIKSKKFFERYEQTECEIHDDDSTFVLEESNIQTTTEEELDDNSSVSCNKDNQKDKDETSDEVCLID